MEGMEDEKSEGSEVVDKENGVTFIDLASIITRVLNLSALNSRYSYFRAVV